MASPSPKQQIPARFRATAEHPAVTFFRGVNISHYLSQLGPRRYGDAARFNSSDLAWIAARGFDHIRLPLDGSLLFKADRTIDWARLDAVDTVLANAASLGLGVVLDLHELPGSNFSLTPDTRLFTSDALQEDAVRLWRALAERYREVGAELWFEILNEPVNDENAAVTDFYQHVLAAIRSISPDRTVLLCANRWGSFETVHALEPLLPDPHVVLDVHYYEPHVFTHQGASWVGLDHEQLPVIRFPGVVPDLRPYVGSDHYALEQIGRTLSPVSIKEDFHSLGHWARKHSATIYLGEFGAYEAADLPSRLVWTRTVLQACRDHGFGWAVWDYQGDFAIRNEGTGGSTPIFEAFDGFLQKRQYQFVE